MEVKNECIFSCIGCGNRLSVKWHKNKISTTLHSCEQCGSYYVVNRGSYSARVFFTNSVSDVQLNFVKE